MACGLVGPAGLHRQLPSELRQYGIRVAWLFSGSPDEPADGSENAQRDEDLMATDSLLKRRPSYRIGDAVSFLASDRAATMTATEVKLTGGAVVD